MMKLTQLLSRSSLAAIALLNLSVATSAVAEPIVVTRGPNGAAHVVNSENIPIDAKLAPQSEAREFPQLVQKGPSGAAHLVNQSEPKVKREKKATNNKEASKPRLAQRGSHGAHFWTNK